MTFTKHFGCSFFARTICINCTDILHLQRRGHIVILYHVKELESKCHIHGSVVCVAVSGDHYITKLAIHPSHPKMKVARLGYKVT